MKKPSSRIRPSGAQLPLILRKKYNAQLAAATTSSSSEGAAPSSESKKLPLHPVTDKAQANRVFTAVELERKMMQASVVMVEIQKQLYKGEEVYMEDTHAHGNLYRGWDTFIDLRDGGIGSHHHQPGAHRRIPADNRWFSASCKSVARTSRPQSRMSSSATPVARSTSTTPVSATVPSAALSDASSGGASKPPPPPLQPPVVAAPAVAAAVPSSVPAAAVQVDRPTSAVPAAPAVAATAASPVPPIIAPVKIQQSNEDAVMSEVAATATTYDPLVAPETPVRRNTRKRKQGES